MSASDEYFMELAIEQAVIAEERGEVPVGALFVEEKKILASSANASIELSDPTAHAEVMVMRKAGQLKGNYRLGGSLYVTLEPCSHFGKTSPRLHQGERSLQHQGKAGRRRRWHLLDLRVRSLQGLWSVCGRMR